MWINLNVCDEFSNVIRFFSFAQFSLIKSRNYHYMYDEKHVLIVYLLYHIIHHVEPIVEEHCVEHRIRFPLSSAWNKKDKVVKRINRYIWHELALTFNIYASGTKFK